MNNSNIEIEEQKLIFSEPLLQKDNKSDKQRKSILKNGGIVYTETNSLVQPLLKENDPFSQKKSKRNIAQDDMIATMASMVFEGDQDNN
jgi:hypothetical protein